MDQNTAQTPVPTPPATTPPVPGTPPAGGSPVPPQMPPEVQTPAASAGAVPPAQPAQATQPVPSTPSTPAAPANKSWGKILLALVIVVVLLAVGGGAYYYFGVMKSSSNNSYSYKTNSQNTAAYPTSAKTPTAVPTVDPTASWKTYSNAKYGYSMKYPPTLTVNEVTTPYYYVEFKSASSSAALPPYLVSAIPVTFTAKDPAAYDYMSADWIANIANIPVGQEKTMDSTASFTRLPDISANGMTAQVIEVTATGYKQHRVYVKANGNYYMISKNYQTEDSLSEFQMLLSTFKLTQ